MRDKIVNRGDWYIAGLVERCEAGEGEDNPRRRGRTWMNAVLIHAVSPEAAYDKGMKLGAKSVEGLEGWKGQWKFLGIAELFALEGDIEDGVELLWSDFGKISAKRARDFIPEKTKLLGALRDEVKRRA